MKKNYLCILFTTLIFFAFSLTAYAEEGSDSNGDTTLAPYFFIKDADPSVDRFFLKETKVTTNINGSIAETFVVQTYANEGTNPINASYVFPASANVSIHGMKIQIGNQIVTAQIKEKEAAKQEFEEAKSEGKSASLLEQQRPNVFTMDVANVLPGDTVNIELHYSELIIPTEGTYQFVFPTVVGPRYASPSTDATADSNQFVATPYLQEGEKAGDKYDITVNLSAGVPITGLTTKSHKIDIAWTDVSAAQITLSDPGDFAGDRDFILDYKLTGGEIHSGLMLDTGAEENFFMLMVQPPERYEPEEIPPREYIFVLDVSGSMSGYPLDTAKELIRNLVSNLKQTDRFNLILFAGASEQMAPASIPATARNIKSAIDLIDRQEGGGGTELAPALGNAISLPTDEQFSRSIITITDGYISGEKEIFELINKNLGTTNFFSFGIGTSVNRYLIDGVAKAGLGESFIVTDAEDAASTAERFRTYVQAPILTDIHVTYDGFEVYDMEPFHIPTLFAQRPIVLFGKWRGEPTGTIQISGKTASGNYVQDISVSDVTPLETNGAIRYLWARTMIDSLTDYGLSDGEEDVKKKITDIGLKYSMMTPYTSFIAVLDIVRNPDGQATDVDQPLPLPSQVSNLAVGMGYTTGSEPESLIIVLAIILMAFISKRLFTVKGVRNGTQQN